MTTTPHSGPHSGPDSGVDTGAGDTGAADRDFVVDLASGRLTWSYRRMLTDRGELQIREVYTYADGTVAGWTSNAVTMWGVEEDDLAARYAQLAEAFEAPVLIEIDLPGYEPDL